MDDLVQWLRAQLVKDEATVRENLCVSCRRPVVPLSNGVAVTGYTHDGGGGGWEGPRCPGAVTRAEPVQDPARVLREIDAKRELVKLHCDGAHHQCRTGEHNDGYAKWVAECTTLRLLALPYADRPGYQDSWRP